MSFDGDWSEPRDISIPESLAPESFGVAGVLELALDGSLSDGIDSSVSYFFSNSSLISNWVELKVAGPMALPSWPMTENESGPWIPVCGNDLIGSRKSSLYIFKVHGHGWSLNGLEGQDICYARFW